MHIIRRIGRRLGFDIVRFEPRSSSDARLLKLLQKHQIDLVFDVGANEGQYAQTLLKYGYRGKIFSFEPLSKAHRSLIKNSKWYTNWDVFNRCAIGDKSCEIQINISKNYVSSSILPILQTHLDSDSQTEYFDKEKVMLYRLDEIVNNIIETSDRPFLKIDTQGYENKVLDGAARIISKIHGIQCELSIVPLYGKQKLYEEMIQKINNFGFELYSISPGATNKSTGRMLQFDAIFFRPN